MESKRLFEWEKIAVDSYFKRCSSIIVTGAGGGREVIALEKMNYTVDGFESNPDLVQKSNEILKELGINAKLQLMPRNECPSVQGQYDGGIVGWSMYMHIQGRNARINFLRGLCTKIKKNGPLLISFYERPYGPRYYNVLTKLANVIRFVLRRKLLEIGDDTVELQYGHYFTREEIGLELHETGFRLVQYTTDRYNNLWDNKTLIYSFAVGIKL
jgi:hypothetical protein